MLQDCLLDVDDWMRSSKLKLNPDKTEVLLDHEITPTDSAQNLGVVFDGGLNFRKTHIIGYRSCYNHIRAYVACVGV